MPRSPDTPNQPDTQTTGKGMPDKAPQADRERPGQQTTPSDASAEASLQMPHERDQNTDMTDDKPRGEIKQASADLKSGKQDTSKQPEMNATYQKQK